MVKDQDYLKKKASFCIELAKKLGATDVTAAVMHTTFSYCLGKKN